MPSREITMEFYSSSTRHRGIERAYGYRGPIAQINLDATVPWKKVLHALQAAQAQVGPDHDEAFLRSAYDELTGGIAVSYDPTTCRMEQRMWGWGYLYARSCDLPQHRFDVYGAAANGYRGPRSTWGPQLPETEVRGLVLTGEYRQPGCSPAFDHPNLDNAAVTAHNFEFARTLGAVLAEHY